MIPRKKAKFFNNPFALQCSLVKNGSTLPNLEYKTYERLNYFERKENDILSKIKNLNASKADSGKNNVVLIHRQNSNNFIKNYRPIGLLPVFGNVFERPIFNSLLSYFLQGGLSKKEIQLSLYNIFSIIIFNELYLSV